MKISRIVPPSDGMSDADYETKAGSIYAGMFGNPNYPAPVPDLATLLVANNDYSNALILAQNRDRNAVANKNVARETLGSLLLQLSNSVMTTANGDKAMLISSNFDLAKEGSNTPIDKPASIELMDGKNAGELVVKVPAVKGAKGYTPQFTSDPLTASSEWTQVMTTTSKYWVRVAAVGPYNQVVYSDAISRVVQ
jgi:hypothetical protein